MMLQLIATIAAGLFSGAALYVNVVEHPARLVCGVELAIEEFGPSYRRASVMQATLAAVGLIAGIGGWLSAGSTASLVAGAVLGLAIPYTLIAIFPTNKQLLAPSAADDIAKAERLLAKWQALHAGRTVLGLCAFSVFAWDLAIR